MSDKLNRMELIKHNRVVIKNITGSLEKTNFLEHLCAWAEPEDIKIHEINIHDYLPKSITSKIDTENNSFIEVLFKDAEAEGFIGFICITDKNITLIDKVSHVIVYDEDNNVWTIDKVYHKEDN